MNSKKSGILLKLYIAKLITFWWISIIILKFNTVNHKHINWNINYERKIFLKIYVKTFYIFQHVITCKHIQLYYFTYLLLLFV